MVSEKLPQQSELMVDVHAYTELTALLSFARRVSEKLPQQSDLVAEGFTGTHLVALLSLTVWSENFSKSQSAGGIAQFQMNV